MHFLIICAALTLSAFSLNAQEVTVGGSNLNNNAGISNNMRVLKSIVNSSLKNQGEMATCANSGQLRNSAGVCVDVTEKDPTVRAFAKRDIPVCGANQALRTTNGTDLVCFNIPPVPPTCTGTKALQWNGSAWSCNTVGGTATAPTTPATPAAPVYKTYTSSKSFGWMNNPKQIVTKCKTGQAKKGTVQCSNKGKLQNSVRYGNGWLGLCKSDGRRSTTVTVKVWCQTN